MGKSANRLKLGILGGTFDPIHNGHVLLAETALRELSLERILFIPCREPPHKHRSDIAPAQCRYEMAVLAVASQRRFSVSRLELRRTGPSFTVNTLRRLKQRFPQAQLYFIIGSDAVPEFPQWREPEAILQLCRLVIARRPNGDREQSLPGAVELPGLFPDISSSRIRQTVYTDPGVRGVLPSGVYEYIVRNRLYVRGGRDAELMR